MLLKMGVSRRWLMKPNMVKLLAFSLFLVLFLVFFPFDSSADPLDVWHLRTSNTVNALNGIANGGGIFVAVGSAGTILTSPDGVNWAASTSGTALALNGVTFGNATFVAVGDQGTILMSSDGIVWTPSTSGTPLPLRGVTFGNGTFVTVGDSGTILTSPDGAVWTKRPAGITVFETSAFLIGVTFGNNQFVIVGGQSAPLQPRAIVLTSPDGTNWTQEQVFPALLSRVTFGNGIFVAAGHEAFCSLSGICSPSGSALFESADGKSWVKTFSPLFAADVAFGNGTFVVVGGSGTILASSDGFNWVNKNSGSVSHLSGEAFGNRSFVAVGDAGTILQSDQFLFGDIPTGHWAESFITSLFNSGVTAGCGNGNYCPDDPISRGQMAVFLVTSLGQSPVPCTGRFVDVPIGHPFCGFIEQIFSGGAGITAGCDFRGPAFCVDEPVTRAQMAVFIEAAVGNAPNICTGTRFTDVTPVALGDAFCGFIERLADDGITGGCTPTTFCPFDAVTRAQMAVFLVTAPPPLNP
jgi:photosystem II stability/assembly factor-like uncharacterized protein